MGRIFLLIILFLSWASAAIAQEKTYESKAPQAILIDAGTGEVLYEKDADRSIPPASMSKLMTQAIIFDQLKAGQLTEDQMLLVSKEAHKRGGPPSGSSTMYANPDSSVRVIDLLRGAIIQSANDACIALAEGVSGTEEAFAARMNAKARELGLKQSSFANSTGLPDPGQLMSVRDLATLATYIRATHPNYFKIYSEPSFTWNNIKQANRNPLLNDFRGADGMKTGFTKEAGYGLVGTAERGGRRLLMVIAGLESANERKLEAGKLMDWGFKQFRNILLADKGEQMASARVWGGTDRWVKLVAAQSFTVSLSPKEQAIAELKMEYSAPLMAPVKRGAEVGKVKLMIGDKSVGETPLITETSVEAVESMWYRALDSLMMMVAGG